MARWLINRVTPTGFDAALGVIGGGGCAAIAVVNAVLGYWWPAAAFAVIAAGPLWHSWRYLRRPDAEPGAAPDRRGT